MGKSSIEWTDETWNPVRGCNKVSPGCKNCYAETFAERWRGVPGHPYEQGFDLRLVPEKLQEPLTWKKPRRVFVNSMSDLFHEGVPDGYIEQVFAVMANAPQHTFQVLTKRAARMARWFAGIGRFGMNVRAQAFLMKLPNDSFRWPLPNVWIGVSVEDQKRADGRIPHLLRVPAAVRFLSCEPLLGPVELDATPAGDALSECDCLGEGCDACLGLGRVHWVIVGGESGAVARPMRLEWARSIIEQCRTAEVPVFVKQLGSAFGKLHHLGSAKATDPGEWAADLRVREWPEVAG